MAVLSNLASAIDRRDAGFIRRAGVPILEGTATGLAAFRHLFEHRDVRALPPVEPGKPVGEEVRARWTARLLEASPLSEVEGLGLLADYGIPVVPAGAARSFTEALAVADRLGWPVVLKTANPTIAHKSGADGVKPGLGSAAALRRAHDDLTARLGPEVTVEATAATGVELALGVVRDEQFGPLVMVAAGGVLVEALRDRRFALPPIDEARALRLLDRLAVRSLLDGTGGSPPADLQTVALATVRLSVLASDLGDLIAVLDVNPLIAGPGGCVAVDVLVVPRVRHPARRSS
jgi:acetate---CoA ligase (ADP-forming)